MKLISTHILEKGTWIEQEQVYDNKENSCLTFTFIKDNLFHVESGHIDKETSKYSEHYQCLIKVKPIE